MVACFPEVALSTEGQKSYKRYQNDTLKNLRVKSVLCKKKEVRRIRNRMEYIQSVKGSRVL